MESNFKIVVGERVDGFVVSCYEEPGGARVSLTGRLSYDNLRRIRAKDSAADPLGEVIDVMKRGLAAWRAKGLI